MISALPLAVAGLLAGPPAYAVAQPRLGPLKPCYVTVQTASEIFQTEPIVLTGRDFTPGALVDVAIDDEVVVEGIRAASDGTLPPGTVSSPSVLAGERAFTLTATERDDPARAATRASRASRLKVTVRPARARPAQTVRFRGRGFTDPGPVYAHYLRRGKLRRTVRLARPAGACGRFSVRAPQFPFTPRRGTWRLQIDQHRRLTDDGPLINLIIDVRRRPRTMDVTRGRRRAG